MLVAILSSLTLGFLSALLSLSGALFPFFSLFPAIFFECLFDTIPAYCVFREGEEDGERVRERALFLVSFLCLSHTAIPH